MCCSTRKSTIKYCVSQHCSASFGRRTNITISSDLGLLFSSEPRTIIKGTRALSADSRTDKIISYSPLSSLPAGNYTFSTLKHIHHFVESVGLVAFFLLVKWIILGTLRHLSHLIRNIKNFQHITMIKVTDESGSEYEFVYW